MNNNVDIIKIEVPFKAQYVGIVRLTGSGVFNRAGFDIEDIEDAKVAISEVCNKIINTGSNSASCFTVEFKINENRLDVVFSCSDSQLQNVFAKQNDELGFSIISALMDEVDYGSSCNAIVTMSKWMEGKV